jgi:carbon storage regulator
MRLENCIAWNLWASQYSFFKEGQTIMLVLSRRVGEEIIIGGDIRVTVVAVKGKNVRIGITAPPVIRVIRPKRNEFAVGSTEQPFATVCPHVNS